MIYILKPQNLEMEVFYAYIWDGVILAYWGPRNWNFMVIMPYDDFIMISTLKSILTPILALTILCPTLIYFITQRKKLCIISKLIK